MYLCLLALRTSSSEGPHLQDHAQLQGIAPFSPHDRTPAAYGSRRKGESGAGLRRNRFGLTTLGSRRTRKISAMTTRKRAAILVSGRGANMAALIAAAKRRDYPASMALVLSNRPQAAALGRAQAEGITTAIIDHTEYGKDREAFDRAVQAVLEAHRIEIVCLAGFMRLFTPWLVSRWSGRMLNIHPALLPAFRGLHTHERALEAGVKIHGATVHFVVPEVDCGPIVAQAAVPVLDGDTPDTLADRVLAAELRLYPLALALVAGGKAQIAGSTVKSDAPVSAAAWLVVPDET
jgi:phosphoribosylglycinamide formyltransferase-1